MDVILDFVNQCIQDNYGSPFGLGLDSHIRVFAILWVILATGGVALYFATSGVSYIIIFKLFPNQLLTEDDKKIEDGQVAKEISVALTGIPVVATLTSVMYYLHWLGYGKLYTDYNEYGTLFFIGSIIFFLLFTDCLIFWIHYVLHWKFLYTHFHATHHLFKYPSPFSAIAFDPFDGFFQSFPYHLYTFLFPFWNWGYLMMFVFVQVWTVSIHDRVSFCGVDGWINGSAHHKGHHFFFKYNYGQYFTFWDRIMGTHKPWEGYVYTVTGADGTVNKIQSQTAKTKKK